MVKDEILANFTGTNPNFKRMTFLQNSSYSLGIAYVHRQISKHDINPFSDRSDSLILF